MSQKLYHRFSAKLYVYHEMTLSSYYNLLAANVLYTSCYYATFITYFQLIGYVLF